MGEFCWNLAFADLQHCGELNEPRLVLVSVMLAEEKLGTGRQLGAYASCGTAAIAAVSSSQLGTCQSCVHWLLRSRVSTFSDVRGFRVVPRSLSGVSFLTDLSHLSGRRFKVTERGFSYRRIDASVRGRRV